MRRRRLHYLHPYRCPHVLFQGYVTAYVLYRCRISQIIIRMSQQATSQQSRRS
jgi:hypothetical protein